MSKQCALCKRILDENCFSKNTRNKDGLHSYCRECNAKKAKEYNQTKGKEKYLEAIVKQRNSGYFRFGHGAFVNMKNSCLNRKIDFLLTEESLKDWWLSTPDLCFYCGCNENEYKVMKDIILNYNGENDVINYIKNHVFNKKNYCKITTMTIDRKDSNKGYYVDNIVKACWICNSIKSNKISAEDMLEKAIEIKKIILEAAGGKNG